MNPSPTTEERLWAVLSHLSALALGMGILLPIIGWSEQRRKSRYVSFQSLQALGYQSLGYTVWLLSYLVILIGAMILLIVTSVQAEQEGQTFDPLAGSASAGIFIVIVGYFAFYLLLPVVAALYCGLGRNFRYPILGDRLARYLGDRQAGESERLIDEHENRWVAAMGHFSVIIAIWGILAPLAAWILQGKQNIFLRFQSIQTTIYQAFVNLMFLGAGFVYLFGVMAVFAMTGFEMNPNQNSPVGMLGLVIFVLSLFVASLIVLIVPFFHILGQWAGYRILTGDRYCYPVIGKFVESWMANQPSFAIQDGSSVEGESV
jgi:uncharacterized Tic20 family protein